MSIVITRSTLVLLAACGAALGQQDKPPVQSTPPQANVGVAVRLPLDAKAGDVVRLEAPISGYRFEMVFIPGSADGTIKPFWIGRTEATWDMLDPFVYRIDEEQKKLPAGVDAVTRPSKPYIPPDRGFGHEGYAAISMSFKNATEFAKWMAAHTGLRFRLPTEHEWEHAARGGAESTATLPKGVTPENLKEHAWFEENADETPHPVGKKKATGYGLFDVLGNVGEWVSGRDDRPVLKSGSFRDGAEKMSIAWRAPYKPSWQSTDPQVPKSPWWLSDAPFAGVRLMAEVEPVKTQTK